MVVAWCRCMPCILSKLLYVFQPLAVSGTSGTTCGELWHRTRAVGFAFVIFTHTQLFRCISALMKRRECCMRLVQEGRLSDIMPAGYLPEDHNMRRQMAAEGPDDFVTVEHPLRPGREVREVECSSHSDTDFSSDWEELVEVVA